MKGLRRDGSLEYAAEPPPGRDVRPLLRRLAGLPHVRGGLIVAPDGLVIAADMPGGTPPDALAALAATLGRTLEGRGPRQRRGGFVMAQLAAVDGVVFLGSTPIGFIVLLGDEAADCDAIRHALGEALDAVRRTWQPGAPRS